MEHTSSFVEVPHPFGDFQTVLNIDMGIAVDFLVFNIQPNLGLGEVIDADSQPPQAEEVHIIRENNAGDAQVIDFLPVNNSVINLSLNVLVNFSGSSLMEAQEEGIEKDLHKAVINSRGKEKVLQGYSFIEDGLLTHEAIKILDSGVPSQVAKGFSNEVVDLDEYVCKGVQLKDILESAVCGTLGEMKESIAKIEMKAKGLEYGESSVMRAKLMDIEQVLMKMLDNVEGI